MSRKRGQLGSAKKDRKAAKGTKGSKVDRKSAKAKGSTKSRSSRKMPKTKCCVSKPRCTRCPLRMLADGTLPVGYTVKHLKLVKTSKDHVGAS